jgi:hypothetical protein
MTTGRTNKQKRIPRGWEIDVRKGCMKGRKGAEG